MSKISQSCFLIKLSFNSIQLVSLHIPFIRLLNIIKFSKKFKLLLDASLYDYKKLFLLKRIPINYTTVSLKEVQFLLNNEFGNFKKEEDENILANIIKEINDSEKIIRKNKIEKEILDKYPAQTCSNLQNILMKSIFDGANPRNLIALYLDSKHDSNICNNNFIGPSFDQMSFKSFHFPYLTILQFDTNFKIKTSWLQNLKNLKIVINSDRYLTLINDLKESEISLSKLKYLKVKRNVKEKNSVEFRKFSPKKSIKIEFPNIEVLIIDIDLKKDIYILKEYFKLKLLDSNTQKKLSISSSFNYFKEKILNYEFQMTTILFKFNIIFQENHQKLLLNYKMNKSKNGLKKYYFNQTLYNKKSELYTICQSYKENNFNKKVMTLYINKNGFDYINNSVDNSSLISNLNYIILLSRKKSNLKICDVNKIFDIKENNYSVQHIIINLGKKENYFQKLIINLNKYKVLKNLIIKDYIINESNLLRIVKNVSKLKLLKTMKINFKGNLSNNSLNLIRKIIPDILFRKKENLNKIELTFYNDKDL